MFWKRAAIYVDPRLVSSLRMKVKSPSYELLACTGFSDDEHRSVVVGDALHHLQKSSHGLTAEDGLHARQV